MAFMNGMYSMLTNNCFDVGVARISLYTFVLAVNSETRTNMTQQIKYNVMICITCMLIMCATPHPTHPTHPTPHTVQTIHLSCYSFHFASHLLFASPVGLSLISAAFCCCLIFKALHFCTTTMATTTQAQTKSNLY